MFEVNVKGLAELEGGRTPARLACEPIANVFDEARGYREGVARPTRCEVTLEYSPNPRGILLTVRDNGPGFADIADAYTLFGSTAKRTAPGVAGRFNCGEKQLIAVARSATIHSGNRRVTFANGKRTIGTVKEATVGVEVQALMPWTQFDMVDVERTLQQLIPPEGLELVIGGSVIERPKPVCSVVVALPTVSLIDDVMKSTVRKTRVDVHPCGTSDGELLELGIPVCELPDFPYRVDVQQKVPLSLSRDMVTPQYAARLIGCVIEQAAMDGKSLLGESQQGAGYLKDALDWVREPDALKVAVESVWGPNVVRQSNDANSNAAAAATGAVILPGRYFTAATRSRMDKIDVAPTSHVRFGTTADMKAQSANSPKCPVCGR